MSTNHQKLVILLFCILAACVYLVLSQKAIQQNEEKSSPSLINATKGSCIWLHWNYTYIGDGTHGFITIHYIEQTTGFNRSSNSSIITLAKKIGENGPLTLESPVPAPFNGRTEVISYNSTLVICGLQYNDSTYRFRSNIKVDVIVGAVHKQNTFKMKPIVSVSVYGLPEFTKPPPNTLDVDESSDLHLRVEMDGNPKPSAYFKWPHLIGSSTKSIPSTQMYPFVYSSTYTLNNIDASYCGRILETTIQNSMGSSVIASTNITVSLKFEKPMNTSIRKLPNRGCLEVRWNKVNSGACYVRYDVVWKTALGSGIFNKSGYNIDKMEICHLNHGIEIIGAQLIVSFKSIVKHFEIKIPEKIMPTTPSVKDDSKIKIIAGSVTTLATLCIIIFIAWRCRRKCKCSYSTTKNRRSPRVIELYRGSSIVEPLPSEPSSPTALFTEGFDDNRETMRGKNFDNPVSREDIEMQISGTDNFRVSQEKDVKQNGREEIELQERTRESYASFGAMPDSCFNGNGM